MKQAFDDHPELTALLGDLVAVAEESLLTLAAGPCLATREALSRQVAALRARLRATAQSELELLLIDRIVVSWIEVYYGDAYLAQQLLQSAGAAKATQAAQQRLDRAHQRFLTSVKALATVHKLVRPAVSPVELLAKSVPEGKVRRGGAAQERAERLPVLPR
jgi:hypothetical protein